MKAGHMYAERPIEHLLKRGAVITHSESLRKGVVIDWGIYHSRFERYTLAKRDTAELIRVWTSEAIEIWPLRKVATAN